MTATTLEQTVGRDLFEVFPMNPQDPAADGLPNLRDSLALARDTKLPQTMAIQKYDIKMPDGSWVERYWSPRNVPILDDDGEVVLLLHRADDITEYVSDRDAGGLDPVSGLEWHRRVHEVEADLFARTQELQDLNRQLQFARDELAVRATHDPLTGLLARSALLEHLTHALARLPRHRGDVAVLFIDLDGLKQTNDTYGHAAGDELIRCCAQRLRAAVRPNDTVARIGGDEFVVLLDELNEEHGTTGGHTAAQRIQDALSAPCTVGAVLLPMLLLPAVAMPMLALGRTWTSSGPDEEDSGPSTRPPTTR